MKPSHLALLSAAGMLITSVTVASLTGRAPASASEIAQEEQVDRSDPGTPEPAPAAEDPSHFVDGATLTIEGQVGHPRLARSGNGETFVMLEVKANEAKAKKAAPVNLALVIDRSGSMKGTRIRNAVKAAIAAVERLGPGDVVSVVTFDTGVQTVVPPTPVDDASRDGIVRAIRGIGIGGDTCISCGVEAGLGALAQTNGKVTRMILLSDGDANHGIKDMAGFRQLAQRARDRGVAIATIGVDVDYNEKVLAAISEESNGRHYFVENDVALARVFEQEAETLTATVASDAEVTLDLAPGVELVRVFDRSFRRLDGGRVAVPLGAFAGKETKTVLLEVRVSRSADGVAPVATVAMNYRDLATESDARCGGKLGVTIVPNAADASELDAEVAARVARSGTVATLKDANRLFEQGHLAEARRRLDTQATELRSVAARARRAPGKKASAVDADVARQLDAVGGASSGFARAPMSKPFGGGFSTPSAAAPQATREGRGAVKQNQQRATDLAF